MKKNFFICISCMLAITLFAQPKVKNTELEYDKNILQSFFDNGAYIIDLSKTSSHSIRDKMIIFNETDQRLTVNIYYSKSKKNEKWIFCDSVIIDSNNKREIETLEYRVYEAKKYAFRIKNDVENEHKIFARALHHDLYVHIVDLF